MGHPIKPNPPLYKKSIAGHKNVKWHPKQTDLHGSLNF